MRTTYFIATFAAFAALTAADAQAGNGKRTKKFHGRSPKGRQKGRIAAILSFPENLSIMEIPSRDLIE